MVFNEEPLLDFIIPIIVIIGLISIHGIYTFLPTLFPGFSPTRPYGAGERETLVGSGHVVPEQN